MTTTFTPLPQYELYIYFPTVYEQKREPFIIYVEKHWPDRLQGNPDPLELNNGRFAHFLKARCQPFSEELWAACEEWIRTYKAMQQTLKDLARGHYPKRFERTPRHERE
jgi:hypothetical protein